MGRTFVGCAHNYNMLVSELVIGLQLNFILAIAVCNLELSFFLEHVEEFPVGLLECLVVKDG